MKAVQNILMNDYELAMLVREIQHLTKGKIDDQKVIQNVIDYQYKVTKKFMYFNLFIYIFFYMLPLTWQMKYDDRNLVQIFNMSCFVVQAYCFFYECISLRAIGFKHYFNSAFNILDIFTMLLYFCYFFFRMHHPGHAVPRLVDEIAQPKATEVGRAGGKGEDDD